MTRPSEDPAQVPNPPGNSSPQEASAQDPEAPPPGSLPAGQPQGVSATGQPELAGPPAAQPTEPKRHWVLIAAAAGMAVIVAAGIIGYVIVARANSDEAKIRKVVDNFAIAVDQDDQDKIISLLCREEASDLTDDDDYDPANDGDVVSARQKKVPVETSDIRVTGDTASARISRPSQPATTLYFRMEGGAWKVCAPAGDRSP